MSTVDLAIAAGLLALLGVAVAAYRGHAWARRLLAPLGWLMVLLLGARAVRGSGRREGAAEGGRAVGDAALGQVEAHTEERLAEIAAARRAEAERLRAEEARARAELDDIEAADSQALLDRYLGRGRR